MYHVCHDRFMKFKMNRYHSKSDEIHVGLIKGNVIDENFV